MRRLPEDGAEAAAEVRLGDVGHRGHRADIERLGVRTVHRVARAQQAPVEVFGFAAHGATLPDADRRMSGRGGGTRTRDLVLPKHVR